jgi:hypothetical protein
VPNKPKGEVDMKPAAKHSVALDACHDSLKDFAESGSLEATEDNRFAPYTLDPAQVGSVSLLMYIARQLLSEKLELEQQIREKEAELKDVQRVVDASISYL